MYIITYFVGHKLKAQFVFSSSVFPNCFTKNNSATREKQIKSIWEALPPQFSSWKSLLHVCILERKNPIESSMKFNIFPSSFSPAALFLSKHISVFHQMAVECTFKKILLEQEYKKWCKSWDWRQPNSNINLLAVGTWARFLMSLVLQFPQAKRGKRNMAIPPRHGPCHLTGTVWEPYMAGSFLSLKFTMSPPPTSPPWLSNMKLTPLSSLVPHPLLFLLILL